MTTAIGPASLAGRAGIAGRVGIPGRVVQIENLLASRSKLVGQAAPSVDDGRAMDLTGFDPFGAAYQQALATVSVAAPAAADADGAASLVGMSSFSGNVAVRRTSSAAGRMSTSGSTVGQIGGYGAMPVPVELAGYGNGTIPSAALEPIGQGGHRLWAPAAQSWKAMVAAARADGIELRVTDSYRSFDEQVDLANRKGLYEDDGYAAVPGTSNHGWGLAVDADATDPVTLEWLRVNAHSFGFVEAVRREPWHWEYRPAQA